MTLRSLAIAAALFVFGLSGAYAATSNDDHLLPVEEHGLARDHPSAIYRKLWQRKLLVTPGNVARFAHIPGSNQTEVVVCINRSNRVGGAYSITVTEASSSLWGCIRTADEKVTDPRSVHIRRCDAPFPDSTAVVIRNLWLAMLKQARPLSERIIAVDSTSEIFSAMNAEGKVLEAEAPPFESKNIDELERIGLLLLDYCDVRLDKRPELSREIEKRAARLLARVERSNSKRK
jgi:hypothetical protein